MNDAKYIGLDVHQATKGSRTNGNIPASRLSPHRFKNCRIISFAAEGTRACVAIFGEKRI